MTKEQLAKKFYNLNKSLYEKAKNPLKCHGPDHHWRVYKNAEYIARKLKTNVDWKVLIPAIFLHDITAFEPDKPMMDPWNHQEDLDEAKKVFLKIMRIKYPKEKIDSILKLIAVHGSDPKKIKKDEPIEATLLRDADKMDVMGPIGIARIYMAMTRRGYNMQDFINKFYREGNLREKYQAIKTKPARDLVRKDYEYSLKFFKELDKKLNSYNLPPQ